jgi:hypothetical protein
MRNLSLSRPHHPGHAVGHRRRGGSNEEAAVYALGQRGEKHFSGQVLIAKNLMEF